MRSRPSKLGVPVFLCALLCAGGAAGSLSANGSTGQVPAATAAPAVALPDAKSIIERHIKGIGGRAALKERKSTKVTASVVVPANGMTGNIEIYSMRPNKLLTKMNFAGIGQMEEGFDGTRGWSINPLSGPRLVTGEELAEKALDADFDADVNLASKYTSMKTIEKTTFDGRECYKVLMVRKDGVEDIDFYDVATGLKAGSINKRRNEMGVIEMTTALREYKKFGPLLQPTVLKQTAMGNDLTTTIASVEFDNVDPSVFDLPAQIKALIKQ